MDYTGILMQAGKILWKHKTIPGFLVGLLSIIVVLGLVTIGVFISGLNWTWSEIARDTSFLEIFLYIVGGALLIAVFYALCLDLGSIGVCKGVWLVEMGANEIDFSVLWQAFLKYFWRVAAASFGLNALIVLPVVMANFMLPLESRSGSGYLGYLFVVPIVCVSVLFVFLSPPLSELLIVAIVSDDLGLLNAFQRIWQMLRSYLGPLVLITLALGAINSGVNLVISTPLNFGTSLIMPSYVFASGTQGNVQVLWMVLVVAPLTLISQGLARAYHSAAITLAYLSVKGKTVQAEIPPESA